MPAVPPYVRLQAHVRIHVRVHRTNVSILFRIYRVIDSFKTGLVLVDVVKCESFFKGFSTIPSSRLRPDSRSHQEYPGSEAFEAFEWFRYQRFGDTGKVNKPCGSGVKGRARQCARLLYRQERRKTVINQTTAIHPRQRP